MADQFRYKTRVHAEPYKQHFFDAADFGFVCLDPESHHYGQCFEMVNTAMIHDTDLDKGTPLGTVLPSLIATKFVVGEPNLSVATKEAPKSPALYADCLCQCPACQATYKDNPL